VAYILTFSLVIIVYSIVAYSVGQVFGFNKGELTGAARIFYVSLAVFTAVVFQPIKRYFDRITDRIFFRDSYDTQEVLDKLGSVIVAEINLEKILSGTRLALEEPLKSTFIEFILIREHRPELVSPKFLKDEPMQEELAQSIKHQQKEVVDRDGLGLNNPLRQIFSKHGVAVSLRLKTRSQIVGYILFGDKRSGDIYSHQDLKMLAIVADELAIAIQNALHFEEIRRFNVTLQDKVEEATKQLRHANQRLKQLDQTKDEFISMASHQLRTPLTTIKGYLSMVLEGDVGPVTKSEREMIQHAFDGAERMVFLIGDLLNVSRLQSGKFVIENKPTDLNKMIDSEIVQLQETAKNHHLTLTYKKPDKFPLLNLDETKIRQVIMNFVDNAIYYTPAEGSITVALEATDKEIRFTVTDTGLGVPKEAQHHLFSKFYRAGNARKMRPDGTGLGLFMAKKVITAQEGAIIFNSVEGKGSTFGFSFPRSKVEIKGSPAEKPKEAALAA
jgi:signal transduction histidine kinase